MLTSEEFTWLKGMFTSEEFTWLKGIFTSDKFTWLKRMFTSEESTWLKGMFTSEEFTWPKGMPTSDVTLLFEGSYLKTMFVLLEREKNELAVRPLKAKLISKTLLCCLNAALSRQYFKISIFCIFEAAHVWPICSSVCFKQWVRGSVTCIRWLKKKPILFSFLVSL